MSGLNLESFMQLSPEDQATVLQARRQRVNDILKQAAVEEGLTTSMEELLVPTIKGLRHEMSLPPVPDRDEVVRQLMRNDTSVLEVRTADNVIYKR